MTTNTLEHVTVEVVEAEQARTVIERWKERAAAPGCDPPCIVL